MCLLIPCKGTINLSPDIILKKHGDFKSYFAQKLLQAGEIKKLARWWWLRKNRTMLL